MAVIKDKKVELCICGREKKTEIRLAKRRVSSWLGTMAAIGFFITLVTYPELIIEPLDLKSIILLGLIAFFLMGITYKTVLYKRKRHSFQCALRRAFLDIV